MFGVLVTCLFGGGGVGGVVVEKVQLAIQWRRGSVGFGIFIIFWETRESECCDVKNQFVWVWGFL